MKNTGKISDSSTRIPPSPTTVEKAPRYDQQMQLGAWQLWRSLPRPCKLFLVVCIIQAVVSGVFASRQLARVGCKQDFLSCLHSSLASKLIVNSLRFFLADGYIKPPGLDSHPYISYILSSVGSGCVLARKWLPAVGHHGEWGT